MQLEFCKFSVPLRADAFIRWSAIDFSMLQFDLVVFIIYLPSPYSFAGGIAATAAAATVGAANSFSNHRNIYI
jgi:hypothetical protein